MTDDATERNLTAREVEDLPDSDIRSLLLTMLSILDHAPRAGFDKIAPLPLQFVELPERPGQPTCVPVMIDGTAESSTIGVLEFVNNVLEDPEVGPVFVIPVPDAKVVAAGIFYRGWTAPADQADDTRDPGDIPGAASTRIIAATTIDGVGLLVRENVDAEPVALVSPLIDNDEYRQAFESALNTSAGRQTYMWRTLRTTALALQKAYILGVTAHDEPEISEDDNEHVCHHNHDHDRAEGLAAAPATVMRGSHASLTRADVENMPSTPLRDLVLAVLDIEEHYEHSVGWGHDPYVTYRHALSDEGRFSIAVAQLPQHTGLPTPEQLHMLAENVERNIELRTQMALSEERYVGVSLLTEGRWFAPTPEQLARIAANDESLDLQEATMEGRLIVGVGRNGGVFTVRRERDGHPVVVMVEDFDEASFAFGGEVVAALRYLNGVYTQCDNTSFLVEPNAELDDLPAPREGTGTRLAAIPYRWTPGTPREGAIFPPIPENHPVADLACWCGDVLADGLPVQAFAVSHNDDADDAQDGEAVLIHQRCIPKAAASFATTMFEIAEETIQQEDGDADSDQGS